MLAEMIPVGTSLVLCARLNFHNFKLSHRIKKYLSYLALASFHDRMKIRCENVGAVLLNVNEGYTTKQCPNCDHHVNVGASDWFACDRCGFERGRDLKVRLRCNNAQELTLRYRGRFARFNACSTLCGSERHRRSSRRSTSDVFYQRFLLFGHSATALQRSAPAQHYHLSQQRHAPSHDATMGCGLPQAQN